MSNFVCLRQCVQEKIQVSPNLRTSLVCTKESKSNNSLKNNDKGLFQEVFSNEAVNLYIR